MNHPAIAVTAHGRRRMQQRGIRTNILNLIMAYGDVVLHAGNGCETVRLSRRAARVITDNGEATPADAARACRVAVVLGYGGVVTALHISDQPASRRYTRQYDTRSARISRRAR